MKRLKDCADRTLYNLWLIPEPGAHLGEVYHFIADYLYNHGYDDATPNKVRRRIKQVLHRYRLIPRVPSLKDYKRARRTLPREDELN